MSGIEGLLVIFLQYIMMCIRLYGNILPLIVLVTATITSWEYSDVCVSCTLTRYDEDAHVLGIHDLLLSAASFFLGAAMRQFSVLR